MGIIVNFDNYTKFGILKKDLSLSESQLLSGSEFLIKLALNSVRGSVEDSPAKCSDLNLENCCDGRLKIVITDVPNELTWTCSKCGAEGTIRNWRKSPVYLKSLRNREKKEKKLNTLLTLSKKNFDILKKIGSSKTDLFIILNSAGEFNSKYQMHIAEFDILRILELVAEKIRKNPEQKNELLELKAEIVESFYSSKTDRE